LPKEETVSSKARALPFSAFFVLLTLPGFGQGGPRTTAQSVRGHFAALNQRILTMAKDFPDDKYNFKLKPEMRTFGAVIVHDAEATLKSVPDAELSKSIEPWISVIEHSGEHYGLLVAYYRANGLVPPESRPK
jgi:hypothetical protein